MRSGLIKLKLDCLQTNFSSIPGSFSSPLFPDYYPPDFTCNYQINACCNERVNITFQFVEVGTSDDDCDTLAIWDGGVENVWDNRHNIDWLCYDVPAGISYQSSDVGKLTVTLESIGPEHKYFGGFYATFDFFTACSTVSITESGSDFFSPHYPDVYYPFAGCYYAITAPSHQLIQVSFDKFLVEECKTCDCDYLEIYDGSSTNDTLLGRFCNETGALPGPFQSTGNQMLMYFVSDSDINFGGFSGTVNFTANPNVDPPSEVDVNPEGNVAQEVEILSQAYVVLRPATIVHVGRETLLSVISLLPKNATTVVCYKQITKAVSVPLDSMEHIVKMLMTTRMDQTIPMEYIVDRCSVSPIHLAVLVLWGTKAQNVMKVCDEACETGRYGADCSGVCHCTDNSTYAPTTGTCGDSGCDTGWSGDNCQVPDMY